MMSDEELFFVKKLRTGDGSPSLLFTSVHRWAFRYIQSNTTHCDASTLGNEDRLSMMMMVEINYT